jgi:hypothetical protein
MEMTSKNEPRWKHFKSINDKLLGVIPKEELDRVFEQDYVDIEPDFLGFVDTYHYLARLVPTHWTVIDFGCAYNAQSYFFVEHNRYIAIDIGDDTERFCPPNCTIFTNSIQDFLRDDLRSLNLDFRKTFAICNYVDRDMSSIIGSIFPNVFNYYPLVSNQ